MDVNNKLQKILNMQMDGMFHSRSTSSSRSFIDRTTQTTQATQVCTLCKYMLTNSNDLLGPNFLQKSLLGLCFIISRMTFPGLPPPTSFLKIGETLVSLQHPGISPSWHDPSEIISVASYCGRQLPQHFWMYVDGLGFAQFIPRFLTFSSKGKKGKNSYSAYSASSPQTLLEVKCTTHNHIYGPAV